MKRTICKKTMRTLISQRPEILDRLSDRRAAEMLRMHYIDNIEWREIAKKSNYSVDAVMYIRRKAADEIRIIAENEVN